MKALVFEEPRRAVIQDLELPQSAADEVLVRSRNVGICHSDFELLRGHYIIPVSYPIVPGHEWSGEVAEVGPAVTSLRAGDRVVGECVVNNGDDHFGFSIGGADAEYFVAKAAWLHRIPDELSFSQGAFVEPFSVAYNATVAAGGIDASDAVAVIGGGPIGLLCTMAAATMGATVTLVEPQAHRRALGLDVGARDTLDPTAGDVVEQAADMTGGRGFDVVIEAAGAPAAMASAFPLAGLGGRIVFVGIDIGGSAEVQIGLIQSKALQVRGIIGSAGLWPRTIRFMANSGLDPTPLLTATFPLGEGTAALDAARDTSRNVKVQIECLTREGRRLPRAARRADREGRRPDGSRVARRGPGSHSCSDLRYRLCRVGSRSDPLSTGRYPRTRVRRQG